MDTFFNDAQKGRRQGLYVDELSLGFIHFINREFGAKRALGLLSGQEKGLNSVINGYFERCMEINV